MALPTLDSVFASAADLPRRQMLAQWLVNLQYSGSVADYWTLPEHYLWAKIAVSLGGPRTEQEYIELPKSYAWSDIYGAIIFNRTAPAAPSSLTLTPLTSSSIKLDWVTNGASVAYSVERSVDGSAFQVIGTTAVGATTATNTGLSIASNYQYRIRGSSGGFFTGYSNTASASTYDANASSFIATSGATDIVAINDFVLGVKTLGLWNSMVCWPLRSSQNAGTGTTAYSLGGLGTFNGTLTNGPTWGSAGITLATASNQRITTATGINGSHVAGVSMMAAFAGTANMPTFATILSWQGAFSSVNGILQIARGNSTNTRGQVSGPSSTGSLQDVASSITSTAFRQIIVSSISPNQTTTHSDSSDATIATAGATPATTVTLDRVVIGTRDSGGANNISMDGVFAFALIAATSTLADNRSAFFSLYKTTLGTGLGLP